MGKSLIIVGANFSANRAFTDISAQFTFLDGYVLQGPFPGGNPGFVVTSSAAAVSNYIDISQYRGRKIKFTGISWRSSVGSRPPWGAMFFESSLESLTSANDSYLSTPVIHYEDSGINSDGRVIWYEVVIPETASYFRCDWFNATIADTKGADFCCFVL